MPAGTPPGRLATLALAALLAATAACSPAPVPTGPADPAASGGSSASPAGGSAGPVSTSHPDPGREIYGYLPYWEMDGDIAEHLAATPLTTLGLFSVTHTGRGALNTGQRGYRAVTGELGRRLIAEAHERGTRVEVVYTSFGKARNRKLFGDQALQDAVIASLAGLARDLGLDGVNVDVESLDPLLVPAYAAFVGRLREAVTAADADGQVSVATSANANGAAMAAAAVVAGADRVFLMGYDYRVAGSAPGATSPLDRRDGEEKDLPWSLDLYAALGVPVERTLLGLPFYGYEWPVAGPVVGAPETGRGEAWILRQHLDVLLDPTFVPVRDDIEWVEVYLSASDGTRGVPSVAPPSSSVAPPSSTSGRPSPSAGPSPGASPAEPEWRAVYVDSPETLARKMGLALDRGLAGTGFWAIGYERGLPGYTELLGRFATGAPLE